LAGRRLVAAALAIFFSGGWPHEVRAESQVPPSQAPLAPTFSRAALDRIGDYIRNEVATGKIPGAILLIQQHGKPVYFECFGVRDPETGQPMTPDTIFQIYSMSKAVTSVAAMMLSTTASWPSMIPYRNTFMPLRMQKSASIFPMKQDNIRSSLSR